MKSRTLKKDKVNIITLGCSKNLVDSEVLGGQLAANDISVVHENTKLDHNISVVNTCGFIDKAKEAKENIQFSFQIEENLKEMKSKLQHRDLFQKILIFKDRQNIRLIEHIKKKGNLKFPFFNS